MSFQRVPKSSSQEPQTSWSTPQFASRPFSLQEPQRPPAQAECENQAFSQDNFEATGLQLKEKSGIITSVEQARLGVLQAKMDDFWNQRMEQANTRPKPNLSEILNRNSRSTQATEPVAPIQPKLAIRAPHAPYEQEAARIAPQVVKHAPVQFAQGKSAQPQEGRDKELHKLTSVVQQNGRVVERSPLLPVLQAKATTTSDRPGLAPQQRPNHTGLPDGLKTGIESLSGIALDKVKVRYNSPQPAQFNALAYTQGSTIHVAPGQERHLPHEAWHVVQQAQGRVQPTMQLKGGVPLNADQELEREADVMGAKALQPQSDRSVPDADPAKPDQGYQPLAELEDAPVSGSQSQPVQLLFITGAAVKEATSGQKVSAKGYTNELLQAIEAYEAAFTSFFGNFFRNRLNESSLYELQAKQLEPHLKTIQSRCDEWILKAESYMEKKSYTGKKYKKLIENLKPTIKKLQGEVKQELQDMDIGVEGEKAGYTGKKNGKVDDKETVEYVMRHNASPAHLSDLIKTAQGRAVTIKKSPNPSQEAFLKLSDEELVGVILYTGTAAYAMNAILRGALVSQYWDSYKRWIRPTLQGLKKLPDATATNLQKKINASSTKPEQEAFEQAKATGVVPDLLKPDVLDPQKRIDDIITINTVYRTVMWRDAFNKAFASFTVDGTYEEPGFSSTTISKGSYGGHFPVTMTITDVKQARSVMQVSQIESEKEVLLPPGSKFSIQAITPSERGTQKAPLKRGQKPTDRYPHNDKSLTAFNHSDLAWDVVLKHLGTPKVGEKVKLNQRKNAQQDLRAALPRPNAQKDLRAALPRPNQPLPEDLQQQKSKPINLGNAPGMGDQGGALLKETKIPRKMNILQKPKNMIASAREMNPILELEQDPPKPGQDPSSSHTSEEEDSLF